MKKARHTARGGSLLKPILLGSLMIWILFFAITLLCTVVLYSGNDPTPRATLLSIISFMLAGALGSLIGKRLFRTDLVNAPFLSALLCATVFVFISAIANGKIRLGTLITAVCFMLISALITLPKRRKQKRHAPSHR